MKDKLLILLVRIQMSLFLQILIFLDMAKEYFQYLSMQFFKKNMATNQISFKLGNLLDQLLNMLKKNYKNKPYRWVFKYQSTI